MHVAQELVWPIRCLPEIKQAGRFAMPQQQFNITYRHETWALHLHDYPGLVDLAGRRYAIKSGDLTLSPPGTPSSYEVKIPGRHWCIHFLPQPRVGPLLHLPLHLALGGRRPFLEEQFSIVAQWHIRGDGLKPDSALHAALAALALQQFILWLADEGRKHQSGLHVSNSFLKADALAADICRRLEQSLTVTELCRRAGLSRNYMSRQFHRRHGMTIARFILVQRLRYARSLLDGTDMQIKTIGATVGMADPRHFNKQFRRFYGASPTSVRASGRLETRVQDTSAPPQSFTAAAHVRRAARGPGRSMRAG